MLRRISTPGKQAVLGTTATNVGILFAGLIGGALTARVLGPDRRGQLAIYVIWGMLLQSALSLGVPSALAFFAASDPDARPRLWRYYRQKLMPRISALITAGVLLLYGGFVLLGRATVFDAAMFVAWSPCTQISIAAAAFLQGMGRFGRFNAVRLVAGVGPPAGVAVLTALGQLSVGTVGVAYGAAAFVSAALGLHWLASEGNQCEPPLSPGRGFWKYSLQSVASLSTVTVNARADQFALSMVAGRAELGIYAVASSTTVILLPLMAGVSMVTFSRVASGTSTPERRLVVGKSLVAVVIGSLIVSIGLALAAPTLIRTVFGEGYSAGSRAAQVLALSAVFVCLNYLLGDVLRAMGRPVPVVVGEAVGGIATVVLVVVAAQHSLTWVALGSALGYGLATIYMGVALRSGLRHGA